VTYNNNHIDISSYEFSQNPYQFYAQLKQHGNVHYLVKNNCWIIIGYNEIQEVLTNYHLFTSEGNNAFDPFLLNCDPPHHTQNRKVLISDNGLFSHSGIEHTYVTNQEIATYLIKTLVKKSSFDLLSDFAMPFSSLVILNLLGIKPEYHKEIKKWSDDAILNSSIYNQQFAEEQWERLKPVVEDWIIQSQQGKIKSILSDLMTHPRLSNQESLLNLVKVLLLGGNETTPNLVSSALLILLKNKDLLQRVRSNNKLISDVVYETLRIEAPTQIIQRVTKEDVTIGNIKIPKGALVLLAIGAANRDPDIFTHADTFDIERPKDKILSFGYGPHYCIGANLAKQEAQIAIEQILNNFPDLILDTTKEIVYKHSSHVRGLTSLNIFTNSNIHKKIQAAKQQAIDLLQDSIIKFGEFPSYENYPKLNENEWHYTYPSPFIHANVLYSLLQTEVKNNPSIIKPAIDFLLQEKETGDVWRFWKVNVARNPVPPDVDDISICSFVLSKCGYRLNNKSLLQKNIRNNVIHTWIKPSLWYAITYPALLLKLLTSKKAIAPTIKGNMLNYNDSELGVMANVLMYLGEKEETEKVVNHCINLWNTKADAHNFYDNDLIVAYHIARAYKNGVTGFGELTHSINQYIDDNLNKFSFAELNLAFLTLNYLKQSKNKNKILTAIVNSICEPNFKFEHFRYFTSKDRNYYGGSACLTAAWFLEVTENW
jgi:cytochrome P450